MCLPPPTSEETISPSLSPEIFLRCIKGIQENLLLVHGSLSMICWSCQQSCFLLTSRVEALRSRLPSASLQDCVGVSRAVEWITVSDTHTGNDLEMTGYLRRREVMEMC